MGNLLQQQAHPPALLHHSVIQSTAIMMSLKFAAIALLACLFVAAAFAQGQQRRPGGGGETDEVDMSEFQTFKKEDFQGIEEAVNSFLSYGEESREVEKQGGGYRRDKDDGLKTLELDFSFNLFALIKK